MSEALRKAAEKALEALTWLRGGEPLPTLELEAIAELKAALVQQEQAGWQLVPVEPTDEMIAAATEGDRKYSLRSFGPNIHVCQGPEDHWSAMLAAAPKGGKP